MDGSTMRDTHAAVLQLRTFLVEWPAGVHLTTRGLQIGAHLETLSLTEQAAECLRSDGLLEVQSVGSTRLWALREPRPCALPSSVLTAAELVRAVAGPNATIVVRPG